jgi:CDP-diglyceride synthetase
VLVLKLLSGGEMNPRKSSPSKIPIIVSLSVVVTGAALIAVDGHYELGPTLWVWMLLVMWSLCLVVAIIKYLVERNKMRNIGGLGGVEEYEDPSEFG